jgi:hypothetical protein
MAVYKVPQDVEAEDHLIGPFGFRQFIYLMIAAGAGFVAFLMYKISPFLVALPLPIVAFFTIIALPLRKDQPTEVYLAAVLQYHLKAKRRMWMPDGVLSTVEITAPKTIEASRVKDISQDEAAERLSNLAQIMDTRGWASRGVVNPDIDSTGNVQFSDKFIEDAAQAVDVLDSGTKDADSFDHLIAEQQKVTREQAVDRMKKAQLGTMNTEGSVSTAPISQSEDEDTELTPAAPVAQAESADDLAALAKASYNPYPSQIHQKVIQPASTQPLVAVEEPSTSDSVVDSDIIEFAKEDIPVSVIADELHRRDQAKKESEEVEIKLH